jgi:DNA-binding beta-propeller fold protein YncE
MAWPVIGMALTFAAMAYATDAQQIPKYKVDASWPKELPNNWIMGQVGGMAVDRHDHIWVLQRPSSNTTDELGASPAIQESQCCIAAPPVLVFDAQGNLLQSWGGPGEGFKWPSLEHGIYVDRNDNVWISGSGITDRHILKFKSNGQFLMQIGHPSSDEPDSSRTDILGRPAGMEVDQEAHEVYIADGYMNKRVIVYDSEIGAYKRMWGAYGNAPSDVNAGPYNPSAPLDQQFRNPVHCVHLSRDGLVYVCDRVNDRMQVFTKQGKFVKEFPVANNSGNNTAGSINFSPDPQQKYLYVADMMNSVVWILNRNDGSVAGRIGHAGHLPGQFHSLHVATADSQGNIYTGEVTTGERIQKFVPVK